MTGGSRSVKVDTPRAALEDLASRLPSLQVPANLADWLLTGIKRHLANDVSLDTALGLGGRRGPKAKRATANDVELARMGWLLRWGGTSWAEVANALGWQKDESSLRAFLDRMLPAVIENLAAGAASADAEESETAETVDPGANTR